MVRINPEEIPEIERKLLCETFLEAVKQFYADPENVRAFEEWQKSKAAGE